MLSNLFVSKVKKVNTTPRNVYEMPSMEPNPNFLGASTSVALKYKNQNDHSVLASKDIAVGDVLFIEKAYAFAPKYYEGYLENAYCQYCLKTGNNLIPCIKCVECLFCNEYCRDCAWNGFHKWECLAFGSHFFNEFSPEVYLALRIAFKAAFADFPTTQILPKTFAKQFGNSENNYPYVIKSTFNVNSIPHLQMLNMARAAALIVGYLNLKTDFFKQLTLLSCSGNVNEKELMVKMGGSIIKIMTKKCNLASTIYDNKFIGMKSEDSLFKHIADVTCPSAELINHSCMPNTVFHFSGDVLILKAISAIKKNHEIVMSHIGVYAYFSNNMRLAYLQYLGIKCKCDICLNPQDPGFYNCVRCNGAAVEIRSFGLLRTCICSVCNSKYIMPLNVQLKEHIAQEAFHNFLGSGSIEDANCCLQIAYSIYKPTHFVFNALYEELIKYYVKREDVNSVIVIMKQQVYQIALQSSQYSLDLLIYIYFGFILICLMLLERTASRLIKDDLCAAVSYVKALIQESEPRLELYNPVLLRWVDKSEKQLRKIEQMYLSNNAMNVNK